MNATQPSKPAQQTTPISLSDLGLRFQAETRTYHR
jgi:hypothetical protein